MQITYLDTNCKNEKTVCTFGVYLPKMRLTINNLRVMTGTKGRFIVGPSFKNAQEEWVPQWAFDDEVQKELMKRIEPLITEELRKKAMEPGKNEQVDCEDDLPF